MALQNKLIFILFGATGDLAVKKIFPALDALVSDGTIHADSRVIAVSRRDWDDGDFKMFLREKNPVISKTFQNMISYEQIDVETGYGYDNLKNTIKILKKQLKIASVYTYLSLAPDKHISVVKALKKNGIVEHLKDKLFIEKPFGTDEKTARALDKTLGFLRENQICRVDHYLGKDTLLALMDIHESTPSFDKLLESTSVASIEVVLFETKGIDGRGASYDHVGAFRDVGQNHMLEMLAVLCAQLPRRTTLRPFDWQNARAEMISHLAKPEKTCALARRGQYDGYGQEHGVKPNSETETAFRVETYLSQGKLKGTPLVLVAGKKMLESKAFVSVNFKDISGLPRTLHFSLQPHQEIIIENRDGTRDVWSVPRRGDAYVNIIRSALFGSNREFVGGKEIEALWRYSDHIVRCWDKVPLEIYSEIKPFLVK